MGGGDSSDGGAADRAAEDRARKSKASADINRMFGDDQGTGTPAPQHFNPFHASPDSNYGRAEEQYYQGRLADYNRATAASGTEAAANKIAREKLYTDTRGASFDLNKTKLDQDREASSRELKFALARSGLFGGSADVDQHALEQRAYDRGILDVGTMADTGVADLRSADEGSRMNLLAQVNAGVDAGSALSGARDALSINADRANAAARSNAIANLFNNIGLLQDRQNQGAGVADARRLYGYPYGSGGATFSTPGTSGRVVG